MEMKKPNKSHIQRIASVQIKKTVAVIKCYICNQMFYSQISFDEHMKNHTSKLSRNVPEEIQRKTLQSFRTKKTQPTNNSRQITIGSKKMLNQTTSIIRAKVQQQRDQKKQSEVEYILSKKQMQQAKSALKQSTLLIQKIQILTQQQEQRKEDNAQKSPQKRQQGQQQVKQQLSEQEFLQKIGRRQKITHQLIQNTSFSNSQLESYKEQLKYINQLQGYIENQKATANKEKVESIRFLIMEAIQKYIAQNVVITYAQEQQSSQLYLTNLASKNEQKQIAKQNYVIVQNLQINYCCECYLPIEYGSQCYQEKFGQVPTHADNKSGNTQHNELRRYHLDCRQQWDPQEQSNQ